MEDYLSVLSEVQRQAVLYNSGPSLVVAGAGSGKTRVLTYKIAQMINEGVAPSSILALTFTNKAAKEMKQRIAQIVGEDTAKRLWMGTFHSIFYKILRTEAEYIGFENNFTIYDSSDSNNLIKTIIKELKLDDKTYKPSKVHARISELKNNLITPQSYMSKPEFHEKDMKAKMTLLKDIYAIYVNRCIKAGAMDFDDLLLYTNILFRDHPGVLAKYQNYFKFILVDEYQDTNFAQHLIVKKLADKHHKVCVVGDDAQSIYSFRGANIENILNFREVYPECKVFKLEENYRSTKSIVNVANSLIVKNKNQIKKNVFSSQADGEPVRVLSAYSDIDESYTVSNVIVDLHRNKGFDYQDFAILYRTNSQSRVLEDVLRKKNIPYKIFGGLSFYQRAEIKNVLAYFKLAVNKSDEESFKRIVNYPARGIGDTTVAKIGAAAAANNVSYWDVLSDPLLYNLQVNSGTAAKLGQFKLMMDNFAVALEEKDAYNAADFIIKQSGVWSDIFRERTPESMTRQQNVEELLRSIYSFCESKAEEEGEEFTSLYDYLQEVSLLTDMDKETDEDKNKVTLMTVHSSKGLEFKNVFVVGMEEELFPSNMSTGSEEGIEEERRLFYVAITRAEVNCFISYAKSRLRNGKHNFSNPSRFIKDIDQSLLVLPDDYVQSHGRVQKAEGVQQSNSTFGRRFNLNPSVQSRQPAATRIKPNFSSLRKLTETNPLKDNANSLANMARQGGASGELKVGSRVEHATFGIGVITAMNASMGGAVTIKFENIETPKNIILKYAKLRVLE